MKIQFNLSPSAIGVYNQSQLLFYYTYIEKRKPDTSVIQCYGQAGQCVHYVLEEYAKDKSIDYKQVFKDDWIKRRLNLLPSFKGVPLSESQYMLAVVRGVNILKKYNKFKAEEKIEFPYIDIDEALIKIKGIIDLQIFTDDGKLILCDWKTSSSVSDDFKTQLLHYAYLIYKKHNIIPSEFIVEYVKIGKTKRYCITKQDVVDYALALDKISAEIVSKGRNILKYELGDWNSPFNQYKMACIEERSRRENSDVIEIVRDGAGAKIKSIMAPLLNRTLVKYNSYKDKNAHFIRIHSRWDGIIKLYHPVKQTFPIGLKYRVEKIIKDYENFTKKSYKIKWVDTRKVLPAIKMPDKLSGITLRDYQHEGAKEAMRNEIGILHMSTGVGKTITSAEIIRKTGLKTLFIVNRIELARQTKKVFKDALGLDVKDIKENDFEQSDVVVATYQTIMAKLKAKDKSIIKYLASIGLAIFDEAHTTACDSLLQISSCLTNAQKRIGLTGTAFRDDGHDMKMNSVVGDVIYEFKKEALTSGVLAEVDITFHKVENKKSLSREYHEEYKQYIVENDIRNEKIIKIATETFKGKQILILTKIIDHARYFTEKLGAEIIIGESNKGYRKDTFKKFREGKVRILVGTLSIFQLGIDLPELDVVINCAANSSNVSSIQSLGRVLRRSDNKDRGYYIDFIDENTNFFLPASWKRVRALKSEGHKVKCI